MNTSNEFNISIKDFQIIKKASLTFTPGLNCIVGQSNNGKSAILRAAKACLYNTPGTNSVRLGQSNYAVGIQNNGHTIILQKGNSNIYKLDGVLYEKIGRTQLAEVAELTGIKELNLNGTNEQINFLDQMEKPFLLDRSETDLFRFIVDSGKDSNVTQALKTITQDRQQITRDIATTEGALIQLDRTIEEQAQKLVNVDSKIATCIRIVELGPKMSRLNNLKTLLQSIKTTKESYEAIKVSYDRASALLNKTDESVKNLQSLVKKKELVDSFVSQIQSANSVINNEKLKLASMGDKDSETLTKLLKEYNSITELKTSLDRAKNELQSLQTIKVPEISETLPEEVAKYKTVSQLIIEIKNNSEQVQREKTVLENIVTSLNTLQKSIDDVGVCPTCGKPLHN